ncbi:mitochondrial ribosomal protein S35 isoform X1 [Colletes latitarsis]|uniref:mitochondrial ribosomal protein S35 isoform X1 n=1 Tax=Colletes latitarsis TaxID=2605962 RepID=UPI0040366ED3
MMGLMRRFDADIIQITLKVTTKLSSSFCTATDTEFRVLELISKKDVTRKKVRKRVHTVAKPKAEIMPTDQNWQAIWPTARTFHPGIVPLPVRQGYKHNKNAHPDKYGNVELMKIPNFLHLTPPAIKAHCEALKKFCTKWPEGLETDKACEEHFPIEIITSDYCYSSPTIREPLARIVSLRVKLSSLHLDTHAKDKLLRLVGERYNSETDFLTITADRCPTRKQNLDYVYYLLTALFHVSWRIEPWEAEKSEVDMEYYNWDTNKSRENLVAMYCWPNSPTNFNYEDIPHATEYKIAVSDLINNGEDSFSINKYKQAVKNMLNLNYNENVE